MAKEEDWQRLERERAKFNRFEKMLDEATEEIEALRRFLEMSLDIYADHFGAPDESKYPRHWYVQARKRLANEQDGNDG